MEWECNCARCNGEGPDYRDEHEICECYDCHDQGYHDDAEAWHDVCEFCDEILVERTIEASKEEDDATELREECQETVEDRKDNL